MKFFWITLYCRLKLLLNKNFVIALIILVTAEFFIGYIFYDSEQVGIKIGISHNASDFAKNLESRFRLYAERNIILKSYSDKELMKKDIVSGKLEYGYMLPSDRDEIVELYISPSSISEPIANLMLASVLFENMAGELGYSVVKLYVDDSSEMVQASINQKNQDYLRRGKFMDLTYMQMKSGEIVQAKNPLYIILSGITALFAMLITFLGVYTLIGENQLQYKLKLCGFSRNIYTMGNITAFFLVNIFIFSISQIIIARFTSTSPVVTANILYCLFLTFLGLLTVKIMKSESGVILLCMISFLGCCIFGGIFFDIAEIYPSLSWISYFTPTHYFMEMIKHV